MNIALLARGFFDTDYHILARACTYGLENLLEGLTVQTISLATAPTEEQAAYLRAADLVLVNACGLFESDGRAAARFPFHLLKRRSGKLLVLELSVPAAAFRHASSRYVLDILLLESLGDYGLAGLSDTATARLLAPYARLGTLQCCETSAREAAVSPFHQNEPAMLWYPPEELPNSHQPDFAVRARDTLVAIQRQCNTLAVLTARNCGSLLPISPHTFCRGKLPELELRAIRSSSAVVGFDQQALATAAAFGIPALRLCNSAAQNVWEESIPCFDFSKYSTPRESADAILSQCSQAAASMELRNRPGYCSAGDFLKAAGLLQKSSDALDVDLLTSTASEGSVLHVCCISSAQFVPAFHGFLQNLLDVHPGRLHLHLLALDEETASTATPSTGRLLVTRYLPEDIWNPAERRLLEGAGNRQKAFTAKAALLRHVLAFENTPLLYSDLDMYFFRSPNHLFAHLGGKPVLLLPQLNDWYKADHQFGMFQAGMVIVQPGAEEFLRWWSHVCLVHYDTDVRNSYYVDQGFLDLAPVLFEGIAVYRGADEDIAFWNRSVSGMHLDHDTCGTLVVRGGKPAGSYHATGQGADVSGLVLQKHSLDQLCHFFSGNAANAPSIAAVQHMRHHFAELRLLLFTLRALRRIPALEKVVRRQAATWLSSERSRAVLRALEHPARRYAVWYEDMKRSLQTRFRSLHRIGKLRPLNKRGPWASKRQALFDESFAFEEYLYVRKKESFLSPELEYHVERNRSSHASWRALRPTRIARLRQLQNAHAGQRCIIVGGSASLTDEEQRLIRAHSCTIAVDEAGVMQPPCSYFACANPAWYAENAQQLPRTFFDLRFLSSGLHAADDASTLLLATTNSTYLSLFLPERRFMRYFAGHFGGNNSVFNLALPLALFMGCTEIMLLGCSESISDTERQLLDMPLDAFFRQIQRTLTHRHNGARLFCCERSPMHPALPSIPISYFEEMLYRDKPWQHTVQTHPNFAAPQPHVEIEDFHSGVKLRKKG